MEKPPALSAFELTKASKPLQIAVTFSLLLILVGFPLTQAIYEMAVQHESPHVLELFEHWPTKANLHGWDDAAKDRSIFAKAIRPEVFQWRYNLFGDVGVKALPGKAGWLFYRPGVDYLVQPPFDVPRFYTDTYDTLVDGKWVNPRNPLVAILRFRDQLRQRGIDLMVIPIPGKPDVYPERLGADFPTAPPSPTWRLQEDLQRAGIPTVDVRGALLRAKSEFGDSLYLHLDSHWTPAGLQIAAQAIVAALRQNYPWIKASDSAERTYFRKAVKVDRFGDVAEMTKLPERHRDFAEQPVVAEQVWDSATGKPYRDDPHSPILWLGDSFSRIYQTDEPKSAGIISQVAYALGFPLASIVNDGGASTVVRQELFRKPELLQHKKLVIWTFVERDIRFGERGWQVLDLPPDSDRAAR